MSKQNIQKYVFGGQYATEHNCVTDYMPEISQTFEGLFSYYLVIFFILVDVNNCFLRSREWKKVERSSLLIMHATNNFSDGVIRVNAVGLMNSSVIF